MAITIASEGDRRRCEANSWVDHISCMKHKSWIVDIPHTMYQVEVKQNSVTQLVELEALRRGFMRFSYSLVHFCLISVPLSLSQP